MTINEDFSKSKESSRITEATKKPCEVEAKTTCELYHAVHPLELRLSVQSSLYYYLHHIRNKFANPRSRSLKRQIVDLAKNSSAYLSYKYQLKRNFHECDVIFNFFMPGLHALGIQKKLAEKCQEQGLRTGIVGQKSKNRLRDISRLKLEQFEQVISLPENFELFASNTSSKIHREIVDQCKCICSSLEKFNLFNPGSEDCLYLAKLATQVEKNACLLRRLLEVASPKLVILSHGKIPEDAAMQIACNNTGIPSMLVPHGFPQKSLSQLTGSFIMSYCPHHDDYLRQISLTTSQVRGLGWIEPSVTLTDSLCSSVKENHVFDKKEKLNILFLSSLSGWNRHRCQSLLEHVPDILKTLNKMPEVETINVRLRDNEHNDLVVKTLLTACAGSKLRISKISNPIVEDLKACDIVMAFNSTALLYGPYLNKKAIEIRDKKINSVWGDTVLPSEQVYQIGEEFNPHEFTEFVLDSKILKGEEVFYNWGCELKAFSECLGEII